jgi:hypothetical protein
MKIDTELRKDPRNMGSHYNKIPYGTKANEARSVALKDITSNTDFNYVYHEYKLLNLFKEWR